MCRPPSFPPRKSGKGRVGSVFLCLSTDRDILSALSFVTAPHRQIGHRFHKVRRDFVISYEQSSPEKWQVPSLFPFASGERASAIAALRGAALHPSQRRVHTTREVPMKDSRAAFGAIV